MRVLLIKNKHADELDIDEIGAGGQIYGARYEAVVNLSDEPVDSEWFQRCVATKVGSRGKLLT